ncbi:MAG: hypothetical protein ACTSSR_03735 [Alphaproteobacteria bacterium]
MNKTLIVACAVAGGLFAGLAAPPPAQALPSVNLSIEKNADAVTPVARRGRGGVRGGRGMGRRSFGGRRGARVRGYRRGRVARGRGYRRGRVAGYRGYGKRRYRGRRYRKLRRRYYGYAPYVVGAYYGGRCTWLRRRAYLTGSPYWWDRYYSCRNYY